MKTIDLRQEKLSINGLLQLAKLETLLILTEDGQTFILEDADAFEKEAAMLGNSKKFMKFLQKRSKAEATSTIDELEDKLKLKTTG